MKQLGHGWVTNIHTVILCGSDQLPPCHHTSTRTIYHSYDPLFPSGHMVPANTPKWVIIRDWIRLFSDTRSNLRGEFWHCKYVFLIMWSGHYWFMWWLIICLVPNRHTNQCWRIVNGEQLRTKFIKICISIQNISFKEIHLIMSSTKCRPFCGLIVLILLIHWGRVTIICVSKLTTIDSDNCLSPGRHQAIIRTNVGILLIGSCGTNFNEILIEIDVFAF